MDLIREELLRQQKALELLLLGTSPQAEPASPPEETRKAYPADMEQRTAPAMPDTGDVSWAGSRVPRGSWEREAWMAASGIGREAAEHVPGSGSGTAARLDAAQAALPGAAAAGADLEEGRLVTEYVLAGRQPETGARELSRLFERDARRYDGGFPS